MDEEQIQLSDQDPQIVTADHSRRRRRRKKAISSVSQSSMDQISVEFVLPSVAKGKSGSDKLLLDVAANWTVEQVTWLIGTVILSDVMGFSRQWIDPVNLVSQVKTQVWLRAVTLNICPNFYQRFSPDQCILLYQKKGSVYEIYDKHQVFQTLDCVSYWRGTSRTPEPNKCLQYSARSLKTFCVFKSSEERSRADPAGASPSAVRRVPAVSTLPQLPDWLRRDGRQQRTWWRAGVYPQEAADATAYRTGGAGSKALLHGPLGYLQAAARTPT